MPVCHCAAMPVLACLSSHVVSVVSSVASGPCEAGEARVAIRRGPVSVADAPLCKESVHLWGNITLFSGSVTSPHE